MKKEKNGCSKLNNGYLAEKKNIFYFLVIEKTKYFQRQNNDLTLRIKLCSRQLLAKQTGRGEEERAGCPRRDNSGPGTR